jgi:hypothetical protein
MAASQLVELFPAASLHTVPEPSGVILAAVAITALGLASTVRRQYRRRVVHSADGN